MDTLLIKIDRNSIKLNPRAGKTVTHVKAPVETYFILKGPVPSYLKEGVDILILEENRDSDGTTVERRGVFVNPILPDSLLDKFYRDKVDITIKSSGGSMPVFHRPEPRLLYEYEDKEWVCSNCKSKINWKNIKSDWFGEEGDDYEVKVCPKCEGHNTFPDFSFEEISEVVSDEKAL